MACTLIVVSIVLVLARNAGADVTWSTPTLTGGKADIANHLKEDAPNGTVIVTVFATDADTYALTIQPHADIFMMHDNGSITLKDNSLLDYEKTTSYSLTVTASKKDNTSGQDVATLTLSIEDVNDNAPTFDKTSYSKMIPNNTAQGTTLIQVHATDLDKTAGFKTLTYAIKSGDADNFEITPGDGTIKAKKVIVVAKVTTYNLTVQADDNKNGTPKHQGTAAVSICVGCATDNGTVRQGAAVHLMCLAIFIVFMF